LWEIDDPAFQEALDKFIFSETMLLYKYNVNSYTHNLTFLDYAVALKNILGVLCALLHVFRIENSGIIMNTCKLIYKYIFIFN